MGWFGMSRPELQDEVNYYKEAKECLRNLFNREKDGSVYIGSDFVGRLKKLGYPQEIVAKALQAFTEEAERMKRELAFDDKVMDSLERLGLAERVTEETATTQKPSRPNKRKASSKR